MPLDEAGVDGVVPVVGMAKHGGEKRQVGARTGDADLVQRTGEPVDRLRRGSRPTAMTLARSES